jgi:hypothetical protein
VGCDPQRLATGKLVNNPQHMALTVSVAPAELARISAAAYEGQSVRVSLASVGITGYTNTSTVTQWDSVKLSGNGYADFTATVAVGGYDAIDSRYEMGTDAGANTFINATFTATGGNLVYDRIYVVIGTTHLHSLLYESPAVTLSSGSSITYRIQLAVGG